MQITFLGTSAGQPTRARHMSAIAFNLKGKRDWFLVDCAEASQHQLLRLPLSLLKLRAIFITHLHGDHCYGLPGVLASAQLSGRTEPLLLCGPKGLKEYTQALRDHTSLHLEYPLDIIEVSENSDLWRGYGVRVTATKLSHRVPSYAYRFEELDVSRRLRVDLLEAEDVPKEDVWHRLQKGEQMTLPDGRVLDGADYSYPSRAARAVIISGDNDQPELLTKACEGVSVLVHESTYTREIAEKVGPLPQHSYAEQVAEFAEQVDLPNLILTHFSPRYLYPSRTQGDDAVVHGRGLSIEAIRDEAAAVYSGQLELADDLVRFTLNREGKLEREEMSPSRK